MHTSRRGSKEVEGDGDADSTWTSLEVGRSSSTVPIEWFSVRPTQQPQRRGDGLAQEATSISLRSFPIATRPPPACPLAPAPSSPRLLLPEPPDHGKPRALLPAPSDSPGYSHPSYRTVCTSYLSLRRDPRLANPWESLHPSLATSSSQYVPSFPPMLPFRNHPANNLSPSLSLSLHVCRCQG
jgi:hypothetical protein